MSDDRFGDLAARCEAATGPDRFLDALIKQATSPDDRVLFHPGSVRDRKEAEWGVLCDFPVETFSADPEGIAMHIHAHPYTASIDAAMMLVPEGYDWIIGRTNEGLTIHAEVGGRGGDYMRFGSTPALALCAAALRARAASPTLSADIAGVPPVPCEGD
jgi:hypothetical protein